MKKMINRHNRVAVKAISIGMSVYMILSPVVAYAGEIEEGGVTPVETAAVNEAANAVIEAVENAAVPESLIVFTDTVAEIPVDISDLTGANVTTDVSGLAQDEIKNIEDEAIRETVEAIVNVDLSDVDEALETVADLVEDVVTDEKVAEEIESTADALIKIYDEQSENALNALKILSDGCSSIKVLEDGSVDIDWEEATEEVKALYNEYKVALESKNSAEEAKAEAARKQNDSEDKVGKLNEELKKNEVQNEAIAKSKENNNSRINELISGIAHESNGKMSAKFTVDGIDSESGDIYRFYINTVEKGVLYGCLTYYDAESKTILRKNFSIAKNGDSQDIDYSYIPKAEWTKGDKNCVNALFGNGGNYIAAYVGEKTGSYINSKDKTFKGVDVSNLMRDNVAVNDTIDARNDAINELNEINDTLEKAEAELKTAKERADAALEKYRSVAAMYTDAAVIDEEMKQAEVEKAKLEYVKAEIEAWKKQQQLSQVEEEIVNPENPSVPAEPVNPIIPEEPVNPEEPVDPVVPENPVNPVEPENPAAEEEPVVPKKPAGTSQPAANTEPVVLNVPSTQSDVTIWEIPAGIDDVIRDISMNLGIDEAEAEQMVVQTLLTSTENEDKTFSTVENTENSVKGERREYEKAADADIAVETETDSIDKEIVTIEENEVPLANMSSENSVNWWWLLIVVIIAATAIAIYSKYQKNKLA